MSMHIPSPQVVKLDSTSSDSKAIAHTSTKPQYTCPMHPEIRQDHPGNCPKCGMTLELKTATAGTAEDEDAELRNMTMRLWIGAALTLPVFVLAMVHLVPALARQGWADSQVSRWLQFALAIPVVWWAGWPFFERGLSAACGTFGPREIANNRQSFASSVQSATIKGRRSATDSAPDRIF